MSIWNWLKDSGNQRTLKFIGGGIAVALALIVHQQHFTAACRTAYAKPDFAGYVQHGFRFAAHAQNA
ncbi:MAG TPA: hypothetical protein PKI69_09215, partial [Rhodocyclaceae bacterium]|nr:hypothetical protein [Rhodocyclaceae bacterium]